MEKLKEIELLTLKANSLLSKSTVNNDAALEIAILLSKVRLAAFRARNEDATISTQDK